jgi:hypothetical protein
MPTDNPAARLYAVLSQVQGSPPSWGVRQVWAKVLNTEPDNLPAIYRLIAAMNELIDDTEYRLSNRLGSNADIYLGELPNIRKGILLSNLDSQWEVTRPFLTPRAMLGLQFCSHELAKDHQEKDIEPDQLAQLLAEAESLSKEVLTADIDETLRAVLIDQVEAFRTSILEYKLRGLVGMRRALAIYVGEVVMNHGLHEKQKGRGAELVSKLRDFAGKFAGVVAIAANVATIAGETADWLKYLPMPDGSPAP